MIRAILIDDEPRSLKLLVNLIGEYCPQVKLLGIATKVEDAFLLIQNNLPDVIFLDIEMQRETGFDLLNRFSKIQFEIIFTTAFEHYALKAIKFSALDYLLKPIDIEELKLAVAKVEQNGQHQKMNKRLETFMQNMQLAKTDHYQLALPSSDGLNFIQIQDILYLKSDRQYTIFYTKTGEKIVTSKNLGEYEDLLKDFNFFRVHHSSLINLNEAKKYLRGEGGSVIMSNGQEIEVSKRKKEKFLKQFAKK
ncbi:MAG: response regulator transcription factor [Saprospiraceae bacterium]|nr:response regulator transcription factor [Saprospiraceae bacterium]